MNEDYQRIDWLEEIAREVEVRIVKKPDAGGFEVYVGRVAVSGYSLRAALDEAIKGTS